MKKLSKRHRDFDAYREEKQQKPVTFKLFNKIWTLSPSIPYDAVLELKALGKREDKNTKVTDDDIDTLLVKFVGEDTLAALRKYQEFDYELAVEVLGFVMEEYGLRSKEEEKETDPKQVVITEVVAV